MVFSLSFGFCNQICFYAVQPPVPKGIYASPPLCNIAIFTLSCADFGPDAVLDQVSIFVCTSRDAGQYHQQLRLVRSMMCALAWTFRCKVVRFACLWRIFSLFLQHCSWLGTGVGIFVSDSHQYSTFLMVPWRQSQGGAAHG